MIHTPSLDKIFGSRLRSLRKAMGWSQAALGQAIGVTFQQVQKYENGTNRIGASRLVQIAATLEVPISYFFNDLADAHLTDSGSPRIPAEAMELAVTFATIREPSLRKCVVDLVGLLAAGRR